MMPLEATEGVASVGEPRVGAPSPLLRLTAERSTWSQKDGARKRSDVGWLFWRVVSADGVWKL